MPSAAALHLPPVRVHFETLIGAPCWKIPINLKPQSIIAILAGSALCSKLAITLLTGSEPPDNFESQPAAGEQHSRGFFYTPQTLGCVISCVTLCGYFLNP